MRSFTYKSLFPPLNKSKYKYYLIKQKDKLIVIATFYLTILTFFLKVDKLAIVTFLRIATLQDIKSEQNE